MAFKTALIVDDSKLARITLRKKLDKLGISVELAVSAQEAFDMLKSNRPDVVFMDHLMPDMDGFEATQALRAQAEYADLPIVMCSGKDHDGYLEEARAIGANYTLIKPPTNEALDEIMQMDFASLSAVGVDTVAPVVEVVADVVAEAVAEDDDIMISDEMLISDDMSFIDDEVEAVIPLAESEEVSLDGAEDIEQYFSDVVVEPEVEGLSDLPTAQFIEPQADLSAEVISENDIPVVSSPEIPAAEVELVPAVNDELMALVEEKVAALLMAQKTQIMQELSLELTQAPAINEAAVQVLIEQSLMARVPEITQVVAGDVMSQFTAVLDQRLQSLPSEAKLADLETTLSKTNTLLQDLQQQFDSAKRQDDELMTRALTALTPQLN